jgi:inosine-uridine nucleoside N-ribohydrolase
MSNPKSKKRMMTIRNLEIPYEVSTSSVENAARCFILVLTRVKPNDSLPFIHGVEGSIFSSAVANRTRGVFPREAKMCKNGKIGLDCARYALSFARAAALALAILCACSGLAPVFAAPATTPLPSTPRKVIIDTDPGTDDAIAILLALNSPELDVRGITVVPGNVTAEQGLKNALTLVSLANRCDIPVAGGAQHPLFQKTITAEFWHGANGLADVPTPPSKCTADPRFAADMIIQMVHASPHEITLLPIGPLTNIALAVEKDPSIVPLVKEVILMGGSISGGNVNASAEANIYGDPEAAQIVFQAGWPLTMVGLDVGDKTLYGHPQLDQLRKTHGPQNDFLVGVFEFLLGLEVKYGTGGGTPMYDPLAIAQAIDSTILTTLPMHVDVETRGDYTRGETVANRRNSVERNVLHGDRYVIEGLDTVPANAHVAVNVDPEKFFQLFNSRLAGK